MRYQGKMQAGDSSAETGTSPSLLAFLARNSIQMSKPTFRFMCSAQLEVVVGVFHRSEEDQPAIANPESPGPHSAHGLGCLLAPGVPEEPACAVRFTLCL